MPKVALITGITGQDGSYLAELLLEKGYEVHGIVRRASLINTHRIDHIFEKIKLHYGDLSDTSNLVRLVQEILPDEILASYSWALLLHIDLFIFGLLFNIEIHLLTWFIVANGRK